MAEHPIVNGVIPDMDLQELLASLLSAEDLDSVGRARLQGEEEAKFVAVRGAKVAVADVSLSDLVRVLETLTATAEEHERGVQSAKAKLLDALRQRARARGRAATVRDALRRKL